VNHLLFLGVGTIARAVRRALPALPAAGTTRGIPDQRFASIQPIAAADAGSIRAAARGAQVVVSYPPDPSVDHSWSALVSESASVVYLSSTAVYSDTAGVVTEVTAVNGSNERAARRLDSEQIWLDVGASVVRLPAFYGPSTGLHVSLARGTFRMPGAGDNIVSRVHEDDAARFVCAALNAAPRSILLAGDDEPAKVTEVVSFVCSLFDLPKPPSAHGDQVPLTLRASRSIDNRATRTRHGIHLAYPTYREGYRAIREANNSPGFY
jgi:nucleoside-diphosphate-sugar epimerase